MTIDKHTLKPATLKDLQVELLKLLKIIDKTCKENNIQYWLDAGTLLGAVRHKGYIPWDDDIDISVPAADYQRLISALDKETKINKNIFLHYKSNNLSSGMVERLATTKIMMQRGRKMVACFVDIFPCRIINKIDKKTDIATYNIAQFFRYGRVLNGAKIDKIYKKNSLNSALNAKVEFNTYFQFSYLSNCNKTKDDSIASFSESIRGKNTYFPYTDIFPLKEIEFEGIRSFAPNNVESYLTTVYGNYMELPPMSEQVPKHGHPLYFCNSREFVLKSTAKALKKDDISFYRGPIRRFFTELSQILGVREKLRNFDNARRERRYTKKY
jgi:lipopolysaccharide cholinephosphotransferase